MARPDALTVAEALAQAQLIDASLGAWEQTAPRVVASLGGRDALSRRCEMSCVGPVPRLDVENWLRASLEYLELQPQMRRDPPPVPTWMPEVEAAHAAPVDPSAAPVPRAGWRIWRR